MNHHSESCDAHDGYVQGCRDCLRAWLDRKPPKARCPKGIDDCDCAGGPIHVEPGAPFDEQLPARHDSKEPER